MGVLRAVGTVTEQTSHVRDYSRIIFVRGEGIYGPKISDKFTINFGMPGLIVG